MKQFIVLAHIPIREDDPAFAGPFALHTTEWTIYTGSIGERQARARAEKLRKHFREVQVREVSAEI